MKNMGCYRLNKHTDTRAYAQTHTHTYTPQHKHTQIHTHTHNTTHNTHTHTHTTKKTQHPPYKQLKTAGRKKEKYQFKQWMHG